VRPRLAAAAALLALALPAAPAAADSGGDIDARALAIAEARLDGGRAHLWRNLIWGGASALGGTGLALASDRDEHPARWAFGVQTAVWGAVDVGIGVVGLALLAGPPTERSAAEVVSRERLFHDALLVNMGLDVGYIGVGATLLVLAERGVDNRDELRGHGAAIMIQGSALLGFELLAWLSSRRRLGQLIDLRLAPVPVTGGGGIAWSGRF
jgi:hypothetical protein